MVFELHTLHIYMRLCPVDDGSLYETLQAS